MSVYHRLYLVKYATPMKQADFHTAILVSRRPEPRDDRVEERDPKGYVYEVSGPHRVSLTEQRFLYDYGTNIAPLHTDKFRMLQQIGRVKERNIDSIHEVCSTITPPTVPVKYTGEFPNCGHWITNVLYRLHKHGVVEFLPTFSVPREEHNLVSELLLSPDRASPSKQSAVSLSKLGGKHYDER